jgi:dTDP-glucose pyrophosphorylase
MDPRLATICLTEQATIRDAMGAIDRGTVALALVVSPEGRLLGTVSDGDIRRALLSGSGLDDKVGPKVTRRPQIVSPDVGRADVLDLMRARSIAQVPVVDDAGRLVGLHVLRELIGATERPNLAVVMAGGRGTRLAPLTDEVPKPMITVAGRPILERLVLHLVSYGIRRIFLAVNYLGRVIEEHFGDGSALGCDIGYLREAPERPLGTAGALSLLRRSVPTPEHPLLVMNGDLVTQFSVAGLLGAHNRSGAVGTVAVRSYTHEVPYGVVETGDSGFVRRVIEKPVQSWMVNAGVYVLEPGLLARVPDDREYLMTTLLDDCAARGETVAVWEIDSDWVDVGQPGELRRSRGEI